MAEVLPKYLLEEIQKHIRGEVIYIPSEDKETRWGEKSGSRQYFKNRNQQIKQRYQNGYSFDQISYNYGLEYEIVRKSGFKSTVLL